MPVRPQEHHRRWPARLDDGRRVRIRSIRTADKAALAANHAGLSDDAVYRRYLAPKPSLSRRDLRYLTEVDGCRHVALVAEPVGGGGGLIGVIRFVGVGPARAEMAVVVADAWQGVGVGRALIDALAEEAVRCGVEHLTATSHHDNRAVPALLRRVADPVGVRHVGGGIVEIEARLHRGMTAWRAAS